MKDNNNISRRSFFKQTPTAFLGLGMFGTASSIKTISLQKKELSSEFNGVVSNVKDFGAVGDGQKDDTEFIQKTIQEGNGSIWFPRGDYKLTRPIEIKLDIINRISILGDGGARIIMYGKGPAFHIVGTHRGTARDVPDEVWEKERRPLVKNIEILGKNSDAVGIRLELTWMPLLSRLVISNCKHGIHIVNRNRNLIVSDCHIYGNKETGIFFDKVNLHQIIIANNHISYNPRGGIKIVGSEIRNIQIVGNDIEYNYDVNAETSADIWFETNSESIREGAIVGNTIQALQSPRGTNIRMIGESREKSYRIGLITISSNHIGNQRTNIHLKYCQGIVITGNSINLGFDHNIHVQNSSNVILVNNLFERIIEYPKGSLDGLLFENCSACMLSNLHLENVKAENGAICLKDCSEININNVNIVNPEHRGVLMDNIRNCRISDCIILDRKKPKSMRETIRLTKGTENMIINNRLSPGTEGDLLIADNSAKVDGNLIAES